MNIFGLRASLDPIILRARMIENRFCQVLFNSDEGGGGASDDTSADDAAKAAADAVVAEEAKAAEEAAAAAKAAEDDEVVTGKETAEELQAKLTRTAADRNKKGRALLDIRTENTGLQKRLDVLEKAEEKRKEADMSELELEKKKRLEAEDALATSKQEIDKGKRKDMAKDAGVDASLVGPVSELLKEVDLTDPAAVKEFLDKLKDDRPLWFGVEKPEDTAGGNRRQGANLNDSEMISKLEKEIEEGSRTGTMMAIDIAKRQARIERIRLGIDST